MNDFKHFKLATAALIALASLATAHAQDLALGKRLFDSNCAMCHTVTPDRRALMGPGLHGIVGRQGGATAAVADAAVVTSLAIIRIAQRPDGRRLLARVERGRPVRLADIVDRLNATYLDWLFSVSVVADVALQLQANWMTDYRNSSGIVVEDGPSGPTLTIEDSSRVDPWIVRQAAREAASCTERLAEFSRRDRPSSGD